jgi:LysM repeat protein
MPSHGNIKILEFIKNRNGINDSYKISEGQKIVIPYEKVIETSVAASSETNTTEYTIKKQDTLTSIAKNNMPTFSVKHAIEMIKETNKITDENAIKEGTLINIPK